MTRPVSFRCQANIHRFDEVDEFGRVFCQRCGERQRKRFAQIQAAEDVGRVMNRPRTKGARK